MVPNRFSITYFRASVPILGMVALVAMFLKLPEVSAFFGVFECRLCVSNDPYAPLAASWYFGLLIVLSLLFPAFPNRNIARGGLIWALLLALILTYIDLPNWCLACLVGHVCNILIWIIWLFVPLMKSKPLISYPGVRLCLILFAPVAVVALFSSLNLTFMAYGFKAKSNVSKLSLQAGDRIPDFTVQTTNGCKIASSDKRPMVFNFVTPGCPYCEEQLHILNAVVSQLGNNAHQFINITPTLQPELMQASPIIDWVEDKDNKLQNLFKIHGYPTVFIVGSDGKISRVIYGTPEGLKADLEASLK